MSEFAAFKSHHDVVISQCDTGFLELVMGFRLEDFAGERILDVGSGYNQQLARDGAELGVQVVSLDPNLPHDDAYLGFVDWKVYNSELRRRAGNLDLALREPTTANPETRDYIRTRKLQKDDTPETRAAKQANYFRTERGVLPGHFNNAAAGIVQALPFADRSFKAVVASSSAPYGIPREDIPIMLAETARVLERGGKGYFWPVVCGSMDQYLSIEDIRNLVSTARRQAETKEERAALKGFGIEIKATTLARLAFGGLQDMPGELYRQKDVLVLTKKT